MLSGFCLGQQQLFALERAKEIKFLQDGRERVRQIFHDYVLDPSDQSDEFSLGDTHIEVAYASGTCDEDEEEVWDVDGGRVVRIDVYSSAELNLAVTGMDLSKLEKEQMYSGVDDMFIYHSKKSGVAIKVSENIVDQFILFPSINTKAKTCKSKFAKEFVSEKSWFGSKKLEDRFVCNLVNHHANVTDLSLSSEKLSAISSKEVTVTVSAEDPENDVLTYNYVASAGKIIGVGSKVVWDLTGVSRGNYSITAAVDDGAGLVGKSATKTIVIE